MRSRAMQRLLTALLLLLAAFGAPLASFAVLQMPLEAARARGLAAEQATAASVERVPKTARHPVVRTIFALKPGLRVLYVPAVLFQRPPPFSLLLRG